MKLTQTKEYLLLIDEEAAVKEGNTFITKDNIIHSNYGYNYGDRVVVAYYPLTKEVKELDLPLLPNPFKETHIVDIEQLSHRYYFDLEEKREKAKNFKGQVAGHHPDMLTSREMYAAMRGFVDGYKAAQAQSKQFSLEDMKKAIEMAREQDCSNFEYYGFCEKAYTDDEIIQSLSTQQLPVSFEPEYRYYYHSSKEFYSDAGFVECSKEQYESIKVEIPACPLKAEIKTIINSEGKEELVGTYKY